MPASTTLVECAPGCSEEALYYYGMKPNETLRMSQLKRMFRLGYKRLAVKDG